MRKFHICKGFENQNITLPVRATKNACGYDFQSAKDYVIEPGKIELISTGIKVEMNEDEVLHLYARSSLAKKKGLFLSNSVGVIDSDYFENEENDGHIMISVYNFTKENVCISKGERIAQGVFSKFLKVENETPIKNERIGGFGSTK